jgi:hypothetical protein
MRFSELVRLLEKEGFKLIKEKGSVRYLCEERLAKSCPRRFPWKQGSSDWNMPCHPQGCWFARETPMIDLPYSLIIEATPDPEFFGFYSPDLAGFTGIGHSIEDCVYKARWGMKDHIKLLRQRRLAVPPVNRNPTIKIQNQPKRKSA